jgi:putative tryptophan/tyrosine transport system substrate-binding protein
VIVAVGTEAALAAKAATTTIPIVFSTGGDPVALGLVASLNRPGGNLTGSAILAGEVSPKRLQLLRELMPNAAVFGVLADPAFPATPSLISGLEAAARTLGCTASTECDEAVGVIVHIGGAGAVHGLLCEISVIVIRKCGS